MSAEALTSPQLQAEQAHQKSEAEIAAQIGRISEKLGERAASSGMNSELMSAPVEGIGLNVVNTIEEGKVGLLKEKHEWGGGDYADGAENQALVVTANRDGKVSGTYKSEKISGEKIVGDGPQELSKDQIITASAQILGKTRGEIARRENAKKKINKFIKS